MRTVAAVVALAFCLPAYAGDAKKMLPRNMEVGKVGTLWPDGEGMLGIRGAVVTWTIIEVGDDWLALRVATGERDPGPDTVVVRGVDTAGLVDGKRWKPAGVWRVVKTEKHRGMTVFSLRPEK